MKSKLIILYFLFIFSGCAEVSPLVGNFNIISVPQERQMGVQMSQEVSRSMRIVGGAESQRIERVGHRLVDALPRRDFVYQFSVVDDATPNAFTIPGGFIYVHTGLLNFVDSDDELAGVMAHELAHAYLRHPAKSLSLAYGVEQLSNLLFKNNQSKLQTLALQLATGSVLLHFSREDEFQADDVGYQILSRSGYQTDGLLRFFKKLQALERRGASIPFLSTHPPTPERIARLEALERRKHPYAVSPARP